MVLNQTTQKVSVWMDLMSHEEQKSNLWWKWLAYGCFSKRARTNSALQALEISNVGSMSIADVEAFMAIVDSDNPEELLYGCPRGSVGGREATLKDGAMVQYDITANAQPRTLTFTSCRFLLHTFSDDEKSEWVNVVVPGFGRCLVRRTDLVFKPTRMTTVKRPSLTSLTLNFYETAMANGFPRLLAAIGSSLRYLTIENPGDIVDTGLIRRCCPNLQKLSMNRGLIDIELKFDGHRTSNEMISTLCLDWGNVEALAISLANVNNPLVKCVSQLRVRLITSGESDEREFDPHAVGRSLEALLMMLHANKFLEYLEVAVPSEHETYLPRFRSHHHEVIGHVLNQDSKLALLSVLANQKRQLQPPMKAAKRLCPTSGLRRLMWDVDQDTWSSIFAFAAEPVIRRPWSKVVKITYTGYLNFEDENNSWDLRDYRLQVLIPPRYGDEELFQNELQKIRPSQFESMFSAIVLTQTTKKLTVHLRQESYDRATCKAWWKWLAYGCFSERARRHSALESLVVTDIDDINTIDLREFSTVLSSKHPEEALTDHLARDMMLKKGALVQWLLTKDGQPCIRVHPVKFSAAVPFVRTFSDDGKSEEVNCLTKQFNTKSWGLKSLTLRFAECRRQKLRKGLPRLLAANGSSLLFLMIDGSGEELDENTILKNCPNLLELSLHKGWVGVRLNFSEYHSNRKCIPKLRFRWQDICALTKDLSNNRNPFTKCARQLKIRLTNLKGSSDNHVRYDPTINTYLDALLEMLTLNQTLKLLEVAVPSECRNYGDSFRIHHLRVIKRGRKLPTKSKAAFLSVISTKVKSSSFKSSRPLKCEPSLSRSNQNGLDRRVISNIFGFATSAVFRQVYYHEMVHDNTTSEVC
ncbi:Hypothetical protein PHPALM_12184 [Phytophthora palmivora]|uniref:Uncharacterized protein n=1 Tax=Phytophthora palmivora TaxID=4796 RepID=A0A2P4Y0D7_9STRA|nr:Hypothetical protein PHPALM_12184 [Phytophthora palmivora]